MRILIWLCGGALALQAAETKPAIYVIGDSTASNADRRGWGDPFADYFDSSKVTVVNRARAGRSSRTFLTEGLWEGVRKALKPGDFVIVQFGHNDGGPPDKDRARGSLPGLGDEAKEFKLPDGKVELVHTFGWYMRRFINETKAAGATPVVASLTVRNIWKDGKVERGSGNYSQLAYQIAQHEGVAFIDLTHLIADEYDRRGEAEVKALFPGDHTHTSPVGADLNASIVVAGWKGTGQRAAAFLSAKGQAVAAVRGPVRQPMPANAKLPNLILIGDSTVRNGRGDGAGGQWGWGEPLVDAFDSSRINVVNRAVGGLSSRTFYTQGHWEKVLAMLKPGDFVVMQFGHNDNGPLDDAARARGTIKGIGGETKEIDNPITKQHEVVHSYGWYLRQFIAGARAKGAVPVVCSPVPRKSWKEGKTARTADGYADWAAAVAKAEGVEFIDLHEKIASRYDALGVERVEPLFADEHTHTSRAGAELNSEVVVAGIRGLKEKALAGYLVKRMGQTKKVFGTFEVKLAVRAVDAQTLEPTLGRMTLDKQFHGALEAASKGEMLSAMSEVTGSAGYVAMERVNGVLDGRRGSFVLQHTGTMNRGDASLSITVVPDSGTGELTGLAGKMMINIEEKKHFYEFEYTLGN